MRFMLQLAKCLLLSGLVSTWACDFSGERSLGTVTSAGGASSTSPGVGAVDARGSASSTDTVASGGSTSSYLSQSTPPESECDPGISDKCDASQFCAFLDMNCGQDSGPDIGVCRERPAACPVLSQPRKVCGCNGEFYDSLCQANRDGVTAASLAGCTKVDCLQTDDCSQFDGGCFDVFGATTPGAECANGVCICGYQATLL